ncbi:zeta toxin family protein [Bacillus mexicanus]|uniref:zeta toxin family protein n=1 Tax=Bacillus mexicanus TaxID=2834415 RepID=UPI003D1B6E75
MNNDPKQPTLIVFAGNNGSGKSTIRRSILEKSLYVSTNIDTDLTAKRLRAEGVKSADRRASELVLRLIESLFAKKESFSLETTLSGKGAMRRIKEAEELGYYVIMYFVGLDNVELNINRVKVRVSNGGHDISDDDIKNRETSTINNLLEVNEYIDYLQVLDNSGKEARGVFVKENNQMTYLTNCVPKWCEVIEKSLIKGNKKYKI